MGTLNLSSHLVLNEGAYFFRLDSCRITKKVIKELFSGVLDGIESKTLEKIIRKETEIVGKPEDKAIYSLLVFRFNATASFFDFPKDAFPRELVENKIGYLLVVEIREYVVIVKKNVSHLSSFLNMLVSVEADVLSSVLVRKDTSFQQMKLYNMNVTKSAMRSKSYEANDLKSSMPMFGSNQSVVNVARFSNDDGICTVNISTSRIAKFGEKKGLCALLTWMNSMVHGIENYSPSETFLSHFSKPQSWRLLHDILTPSSLLINVFELQNYFETKLADKTIYRKIGKDNYRDWSAPFWRMFRNGCNCLELKEESTGKFHYKSIGVIKCSIGMRFIADKPYSELYYKDDNGRYHTLSTLLNSLHCFTVGFEDCSYLYVGGRVYKNEEFIQDIDSILEILIPVPEFKDVTSEKGQGYNASSKEFREGSLFRVVEEMVFKDADFLLCDDMGNEWADHIALQGNTLSFVHSKYKELSLSASNFQDVIGQAMKNIGNMSPSDEELGKKLCRMRVNWCNTGIPKCRKGTIDGYKDAYNRLKNNPNAIKRVCLAVNFLSKITLRCAIRKIKRGETFKQRNNVVQLLWLLNGFISTCKQADLHCAIYCRR